MSALPAVELTCDSDVRPPRALRPAVAPADPRDDTPATPRDTTGSRRDTPGAQRDAPHIRNDTPRIRRDTPAASHGPSPRAARQDLVQVVVRPGQSLWSVAESADPGQDTRAVIQQIIDLNSLTGDTVFAGQRLWVPRG